MQGLGIFFLANDDQSLKRLAEELLLHLCGQLWGLQIPYRHEREGQKCRGCYKYDPGL